MDRKDVIPGGKRVNRQMKREGVNFDTFSNSDMLFADETVVKWFILESELPETGSYRGLVGPASFRINAQQSPTRCRGFPSN